MTDPILCPNCASPLPPDLLWSDDQARCPTCDAAIEMPDVLAAVVDGSDAQLDAFPDHQDPADLLEPRSTEDTDPGVLHRQLDAAVAALEKSVAETMEDLDAMTSSTGYLVGDDVKKMLEDLRVTVPADDAPIDELERALADARAALDRLDHRVASSRTTAEDLRAFADTIDPDAILADDERTDPSLFVERVKGPGDTPESSSRKS